MESLEASDDRESTESSSMPEWVFCRYSHIGSIHFHTDDPLINGSLVSQLENEKNDEGDKRPVTFPFSLYIATRNHKGIFEDFEEKEGEMAR